MLTLPKLVLFPSQNETITSDTESKIISHAHLLPFKCTEISKALGILELDSSSDEVAIGQEKYGQTQEDQHWHRNVDLAKDGKLPEWLKIFWANNMNKIGLSVAGSIPKVEITIDAVGSWKRKGGRNANVLQYERQTISSQTNHPNF